MEPIRFIPNKQKSVSGRAPATPKGKKKDFKKVLAREEHDHPSDQHQKKKVSEEKLTQPEVNLDKKLAKEQKKQGATPPSIFDLSQGMEKTATKEGEPDVVAATEPKKDQENLFQLVKEEPETQGYQKVTLQEEKAEIPRSPVQEIPEKKIKAEFSREQPDLAQVNPIAEGPKDPTHVATQRTSEPLPPQTDQAVKEILTQVVDRIYTLEKSGETQTVVTLKHPVLKEAHLVIKEFNSAKGEFNIAFENLTQAGKEFLDGQLRQNTLQTALEQKGYVVHILTTTTLAETRPSESSSYLARDDRQQKDEREGQREKDEEEET